MGANTQYFKCITRGRLHAITCHVQQDRCQELVEDTSAPCPVFPSKWRTSRCRSRGPNHNRPFKASTTTCTRAQHYLPFSLRCRYSKWRMWTCLSCIVVFWLPLHRRIYYDSALPCERLKLACQVCHMIMSMFVCIPHMFSKIDVLHHWLIMRLPCPEAMRPDLLRFCASGQRRHNMRRPTFYGSRQTLVTFCARANSLPLGCMMCVAWTVYELVSAVQVSHCQFHQYSANCRHGNNCDLPERCRSPEQHTQQPDQSYEEPNKEVPRRLCNFHRKSYGLLQLLPMRGL